MATDRDLEIARLSIEKGLVLGWQIQECLEARRGRPLEAVLVERGYLTMSQLSKIDGELAPARTPRTPEILPPEIAEAAKKPGSVLGKYVLLQELGAGGMGVVYKAWQSDLKRTVALKFIRGVEAQDDLQRFMREAQTAAQLSHTGIVSVFETGEIDGKHYIAMPFVDGLTLDKILGLRDPFPVRRLVAILAEAARAVDYANAQGIIHRDLKPGNVIVEKEGQGRVYVMDFGLAKSIKTGSTLTVSGMILGTPSYMSPEQAVGDAAAIEARSDVYALGAILYEIGAGRPPFSGEAPMDVLVRVVHEDPPAPRKLNPKFHPDLETIALKAMEKSKARRYASAAAFADDLQHWLDGELISARPAGPFSKLLKRVRKQKAVTAAIAIAVVGLLAGGAFGVSALFSKGRVERQRGNEQQKRLESDRLQYEAAKRRDRAHGPYEEALRDFERADRERFIEPADGSHQLEELSEAEGHLRAALLEDPGYADAHLLLGRVLTLLALDTEAIEELSRAIALEPGNVRALVERGLARLRIVRIRSRKGYVAFVTDLGGDSARFDVRPSPPGDRFKSEMKAIDEDLREAARRADKPFERALAAGVAAALEPSDDAERLRAAEDHLDRAVTLEPNLPEAYLYRSGVRWDRGEAEQALADAERAVLIAPNDPMSLQNVSNMFVILGRAPKALPHSDRLVRLRPKWSATHEQRSLILMEMRRYDDAILEAKQGMELDPDRDTGWCSLGVALVHSGRRDEALEVLNRGLERFPKSGMLHQARGYVRATEPTQTAEALPDFEAAIEAAPEDPEPRVNRGVILGRLGRWEEALSDYREALRLDPSHPKALVYAAMIPFHQHRPEESLKALKELEKKGTSPGLVQYEMAFLLCDMGRASEAEKALEAARKSMSDDSNVYSLGAMILNEENRSKEALAEAERCLKIDPRNREGKFQHATALAKLDRFQEAEKEFKALLSGWESWNARFNYGMVLARLGRPGEALAEFDRAIELNPEASGPYHARGLAKIDLGDAEGAEKDLSEALSLCPPADRARIRLDRAQFYGATGRFQQSVDDLLEAERLGASSVRLYAMRGYSYRRLMKLDQALADFEKAISMDPKFPQGYVGRAQVKADQGKPAEALKDFEKAIELDPGLKPALKQEMDALRKKIKD